MRVLVTGANGLVGRNLRGMLQTQGCVIIPAVRQVVTTDDVFVGDIDGQTSWAPVLKQRPDAVVHLAARVHVMASEPASALQQYREVNTEGSLNLARQCAEAGVKRFVFVSTVKVLGEGGVSAMRASDPAQPDGVYAESKWLAEQGLREISRDTGMEVVIMRPPLIYGPGVKGNFLNMLRAVDCGLPLPLGCVRNSRSLVYVGNLASAVHACLVLPAAAGKTYMVSDSDDVSTPELLRRVGAALSKSARLLPVPQYLLRLGGFLVGKQAAVQRLLGSLVVDSTPIQRELGWKPPYTMQQGLQETAMWYRSLKGTS